MQSCDEAAARRCRRPACAAQFPRAWRRLLVSRWAPHGAGLPSRARCSSKAYSHAGPLCERPTLQRSQRPPGPLATYQGSAQIVGLLKERSQDYFLAATDVVVSGADAAFSSWNDELSDGPYSSSACDEAPGRISDCGSDGGACGAKVAGPHATGVVSRPAADGPPSIVVTGVFDGHGGEGAARYAQESLMSYIANDRRLHASLVAGDPQATSTALKAAFRKVDQELLALAGQPSRHHSSPPPSPPPTPAPSSPAASPALSRSPSPSPPQAAGPGPHAMGTCNGNGNGCTTYGSSSGTGAAAGYGYGCSGSGAAAAGAGAAAAFPPPPGSFRDGTTALLTVQCGGLLAVANVGDSRAVLCRGGQAVRLSRDHTPALRSERERIEAAGGKVVVARGAARVVVPLGGSGDIMQALSVSRSLGDPDFKVHGLVISEPDVTLLPLQPPGQPNPDPDPNPGLGQGRRESGPAAAPAAWASGADFAADPSSNGNGNGSNGKGAGTGGGGDWFLIAASDGLWGRVGDQEAVDCVAAVLREYAGMSHTGSGASPSAPARAAARALLRLALDSGSVDDVTVVVCVFDWGRR